MQRIGENMAFENVDINSLKNAISSCRNSINYNYSRNLLLTLNSNTIWQADAKQNVKRALENLINNKYRELEEELNNCSNITNLIAQYKQAEEVKTALTNQYNELNKQLYYEESYTENHWNGETNSYDSVAKKRTVKNTSVEQSMNTINNQKQEQENTMTNLLGQINGLL